MALLFLVFISSVVMSAEKDFHEEILQEKKYVFHHKCVANKLQEMIKVTNAIHMGRAEILQILKPRFITEQAHPGQNRIFSYIIKTNDSRETTYYFSCNGEYQGDDKKQQNRLGVIRKTWIK